MQSNRTHGGVNQFSFEKTMLDFSVNLNSYGPSYQMKQSIANAPFENYPDPNCRILKKKISESYKCSPEEIHLGNGAAEIFWSIASAFGKSSSPRTIIVEPTFSEFHVAATAHQYTIDEIRAEEKTGFQIPLDPLGLLINECHPNLVYLCSPNSPTGVYTPPHQVELLANTFPQCTFILDQAFIKMSPHGEDINWAYPENVIQVFSFTKDHSIPGIRLGFAKSFSKNIKRLEAVTPTWNVSSIAQEAGLAALNEESFVQESFLKIQQDKKYLMDRLLEAGIEFHKGDCPFLLIKGDCGDRIQKDLSSFGIWVRSCSSYGLNRWVRVFARPKADCDLLINALKKVMK